MSAPLFLASILFLAPLADEGDDRYHFISGLAEKGLHEMVVKEATRFLEQFPDHARSDLARYRLASALFDLGRLDGARPHFAALAAEQGFRFRDEVAFRHGQCELEAGDHDAAVRAFERARNGEADYLRTSATFLLAEAHFRAERFARAAVFYKSTLEAADGGDHEEDSVHGLAWCAFRTGDHDEAIAFVETFLERWPGSERDGEMLFLSGESHLEAGRPKEALADYLRVEQGTFHPAALRGAGFACAGLTDHPGAAAHFQALIAAYPESRYTSESALHGGIHLLKANEPERALVLLTSKAAGEDSEVFYWRGRTLAKLGDHERALAAFVSGLKADPSEDLARRLHVGRGDALYDLGNTTGASEAFQVAGSDYALHAAAVARLNDGFPDEAAQLAAQLVDPERQSPYRLEAALTLAEAHFAQKHYDQALVFFAVVASEDDDGNRRARATTRMGWCQYLVADMQGARQYFELVNANWPASPDAGEARFMAGRAAEETGDEGAAAEAYALYLFDHAGETYGDEAAVRLARYEGGSEAEERLEQLLAASPESELVPQAHHDLAERLADREEWASAREHYSAVVTNHPQHVLEPPARYGLAWCLFSEEQFAESLGHLETLVARGEHSNGGAVGPAVDLDLRIAALELAVWAARRAGEPDRARAAFASYSEIAPDEERRLRAARVAAAALKDADRIPDAEALLFELLGRTRDRAVAVGICVECTYLALDRGDVAAAEAQARAAHRYTPDDASLGEAFFFVGEAHFEAGADEAAAACYAIAADATDPDVASRALYKGGFAHLRRDDHDAAGRCFHRLVSDHETSDLFGESLFLLGESHFRAGRYAQAVEWLERTRKEAPEHAVLPRALYRLGVAQARTQRWRDSAETLSLLAREHSEFEHLVEADLWRGRALAGLDQRRGARAAFERVIEKDRGLLAAQAHIELGRLALAVGDRDEALSKFLYVAVLFAHPDEVSEALFMAGQILESEGSLKQAADRYREAVTQFPDTDFTRRAKARLAEIDQ